MIYTIKPDYKITQNRSGSGSGFFQP